MQNKHVNKDAAVVCLGKINMIMKFTVKCSVFISSVSGVGVVADGR